MKKRLFSLFLVLVLIAAAIGPIRANAATISQEAAVTSFLRWAKFTQSDADIVGGWVELAYYVNLVQDADDFDADAPCTTKYYNTLRMRANELFRRNSVSKIPVYPFIKVETQPKGAVVDLGVTVTLTVAASVSNGTEVAYQWYSCTNIAKTNAAAISGAITNTLTVAPTEGDDLYYFCRFSAKTAENVEAVDSDVVCVTDKPYITVLTQPKNLTPERGGDAALLATAVATNGGEVARQWYSCDDAQKTNAKLIEGETLAVFHAPTDMYGDYYYFCRFSSKDLKDVDSDVVCVDVPVMMYDENGLALPILTYTNAKVTTYTNTSQYGDGHYNDIVRFCVYVETDYDTDDDGKLDLVKAVVQLPRAAMEGEYDAAVIYEARPYCAGTQNYEPESGTYDVSLLYSTAAPRTVMGTATTAEVAAAANASDFYFYENLDWYDYFLVRGYAVVVSAGPGTKGSEGFETCGTDLEIDAFACVIEWLTGDRVAYTDKTSNIAVEADWCNGQVGMTGRSYAGTTQFGLATTGVEGLETIVPVGGIASWYEYSCSQGMYLRDEGYTNWLAGYCASRIQDTSDWSTVGTKYASYLAQLDKDEEALYGSYGEDDGFWGIRDYTRNAANIQCPALIVHGLNDNNVRTKNFQMMYDAYQIAGADVKLLLFQDGHVTPAYGKNKTEQFINGEAYQQVLNRWFTYHLYDIDNGADEMAAVTVQDNVDGSWDTYPSWETNESMSMAFSPDKTIQNYSSGITSGNYVSTYTAGNTDYSVVQIQEITEDVTIAGTVKVTVTATPQIEGNNQMLTAFLVDMSDTAFNAYNPASSYEDVYHADTGEIFDVGGGAESYTVVQLVPSSVTSKIIASGWIDLANPGAGFSSSSAVEEGNSTIAQHTYDIYLQPNLYTVKAGHKLALVICTRDPSMDSKYKYANRGALYNVLISDVEATIPVYPEYTYYSTWDSAITDANNGTVGKNADATAESAVSCVYVDGNQIANVVLLRDAETAGMEIAKDMVINLNGHKLSMTEGNITFAIRHTIGTLVVDGTKKGSSIEVKNSDKNARCIRADAETLTVNGGTYVATSGKSARPIQVDYDCTATITDCEITAFGGEKTATGGVLNWGTATLTNCSVSAHANYNTNLGEYSMGVYGDGPLILNNCYVYGTHSSVQCRNTLVINGGTYESPGHGVYISCTDKIAHIRNATIRFCEMKEGYIHTAGAMGPGLYIGGSADSNNVTLYIDNCDIYSKTKNAQIILRGTSGEQNNKVYISNSRLYDLGGEKLYVRIDNLTHRLYLGAGNNFNTENTTIKALYDSNSMLPAVIETGETYDSIP